MHYEFTAIPDADLAQAVDPVFQHLVQTYASETNKTASVWKAVPDDLLDFKPHDRTNSIRTILVHQLLSERRFFAQFVGTKEPPVEELLPPGEKPVVQAYIDKFVSLAKLRLPQLAAGTTSWWLESRPFFSGLQRERIWAFWRRVLHTCHHRTQVQMWLRLAGHEPVPAIYGPSGDVKWDEADPTYSLEAAKRGACRTIRPLLVFYFGIRVGTPLLPATHEHLDLRIPRQFQSKCLDRGSSTGLSARHGCLVRLYPSLAE